MHYYFHFYSQCLDALGQSLRTCALLVTSFSTGVHHHPSCYSNVISRQPKSVRGAFTWGKQEGSLRYNEDVATTMLIWQTHSVTTPAEGPLGIAAYAMYIRSNVYVCRKIHRNRLPRGTPFVRNSALNEGQGRHNLVSLHSRVSCFLVIWPANRHRKTRPISGRIIM